jgi:hypothetical protein
MFDRRAPNPRTCVQAHSTTAEHNEKGDYPVADGIRNERWSTRIEPLSLPRKFKPVGKKGSLECLPAIRTDRTTGTINEPRSCTTAPPTRIAAPPKIVRNKITRQGRSSPGKISNIPNRLTSIATRCTRNMSIGTASLLLGTRKSPNWRMHYGTLAAVRKDRRKRTGSTLCTNYGPVQKPFRTEHDTLPAPQSFKR